MTPFFASDFTEAFPSAILTISAIRSLYSELLYLKYSSVYSLTSLSEIPTIWAVSLIESLFLIDSSTRPKSLIYLLIAPGECLVFLCISE